MNNHQNKRLIENLDILEKSGFVKRNHIKILSVIIVLYTLAFITTSFVAYLYEHDPIADIIAFITLFGIATIMNVLYLKDINDKINATEFQNLIFSSGLRADSDYCLIFNHKAEVIYSSSNFYSDYGFSQKKLGKLTFDDVAIALNLTPEQISKLSRVIDEKNSLTNDIDDASNKKITFKNYSLEIDNISLAATKYHRPLGFSCLKINLIDKDEILSKILNNFNIGFYELDPTGFLLNSNEYLSRNLGFSHDMIMNSQLSLKEFIDNEHIPESMYEDENIKESWQGFLHFKNKYGEIINAFIVQKPVYSSKGLIDKIIGYTFRVEDDKLMLKSKGFKKGWIDYSWKSFFESSPYPVLTLNNEGQIERINDSAISVIGENLIGKKFFNLFNLDNKKLILSEIETSLSKNKKNEPLKGIYAKRKDKSFEIYLSRILDLENCPYGFIVRLSDITKQNQLQESLSHTQRIQTMGQLVGSVAHDFNNILTAISGFCDLLLIKHKASDPSFINIMQIKQSADRATNLVKRLLAFSRKQTLKPDIINLTDLFNNFDMLIQRLIGSEINYKINVDSKLWDILVDPVQIEQVILNLVINARQAMDSYGTLRIDVKNIKIDTHELDNLKKYFNPAGNEIPQKGDYIRISIKDTGKGISKKNLPRIFEPFFTTKAEKSGTGLGLATVYGIIKQSDGHIFVHTVVNKGTEFIILLKKLDESDVRIDYKKSKVEHKKIKESIKDTTGKETIVLVEDEESVRQLAKNIFEGKGYNVIDYSSAKSAFERKDEFINIADMIVTDVIMPEMTGPAFIKEIHKINPKLKVLFMSGYGEDAFTEEYGTSRNFNFIAKPFSLKDLASKVKEILN